MDIADAVSGGPQDCHPGRCGCLECRRRQLAIEDTRGAPADSLLILISHNLQRQLPTIRSRCQILHFSPLASEDLTQLLVDQGIVESAETASSVAQWSDGSLETAQELLDPDWQEFHQQLESWLGQQSNMDPVKVAKEINTFVDAGGSELPVRRGRLRQVFRVAERFFRRRMLSEATAGHGASELNADLGQLDRSLLALEQLDSMAHPATLVDAWVDDLFVLSGRPL